MLYPSFNRKHTLTSSNRVAPLLCMNASMLENEIFEMCWSLKMSEALKQLIFEVLDCAQFLNEVFTEMHQSLPALGGNKALCVFRFQALNCFWSPMCVWSVFFLLKLCSHSQTKISEEYLSQLGNALWLAYIPTSAALWHRRQHMLMQSTEYVWLVVGSEHTRQSHPENVSWITEERSCVEPVIEQQLGGAGSRALETCSV